MKQHSCDEANYAKTKHERIRLHLNRFIMASL